jgi:hypothetical protein
VPTVRDVDRVDHGGPMKNTCSHCGAAQTRRLGECCVCHRGVCEHCGNVQFGDGTRKVTHHECLKRHDHGFKMIKFVR